MFLLSLLSLSYLFTKNTKYVTTLNSPTSQPSFDLRASCFWWAYVGCLCVRGDVVLCWSEGFLGQSARINQSQNSSIHSSAPGPLISDSFSVFRAYWAVEKAACLDNLRRQDPCINGSIISAKISDPISLWSLVLWSTFGSIPSIYCKLGKIFWDANAHF